MAVNENALSDPSRVTRGDYEAMLQRHGRGWVFEDGGRILGFAIADHTHRNIWALFVEPGFERRGIGRELLQRAVRWLFDQGDATIWLSTGRETRAYRFYKAAGWREAGIEPNGDLRLELARANLDTHGKG